MTNISIDELKDRMSAGEKLNILDVREPHENTEFNIGGILVPLGQIQTMQLDEIENLENLLQMFIKYNLRCECSSYLETLLENFKLKRFLDL